jgi:hypothetical protein
MSRSEITLLSLRLVSIGITSITLREEPLNYARVEYKRAAVLYRINEYVTRTICRCGVQSCMSWGHILSSAVLHCSAYLVDKDKFILRKVKIPLYHLLH